MKLNIGEQLRRHRRERDMTQEQLAELLGVSFQAVSRWENGAAYPDIELLPILAELFETSVDKLMGLDEAEKDRQAHQAISDFLNACDESEPIDRLVEMLKGIRREHIASKHIQLLFYHWMEQYKAPEILAELRTIAEIRLERYPDRIIDQDLIERMSLYDDEEHALELIKNHSTMFDMTEGNLLHNRYDFRGEYDKLEPYRQSRIRRYVNRFILAPRWNNPAKTYDAKYFYDLNNMLLGLLNSFCGSSPDYEHQVSGNGEIDIYVENRLDLGLHRSAYVAALGDTEQAFVIMEDTISLLEKLMSLPNGFKITGTSQFIPDVYATVEHIFKPRLGQFTGGPTVRLNIIDGITVYKRDITPLELSRPFVMPGHWAWFDPIRNDPRFAEYTARIHALCNEI